MSITQDLAAVAVAADNLTQQVSDKISQIDARVNQFQTDATNIVATATDQISRANIGINQAPNITITAMPDEDVSLAVIQAYADGAKHVTVHWSADGQLRHWNTMVSMPVGASLRIEGPNSTVTKLGGNIRTEYGCFANGFEGGTSQNGSPMIFRNLTPSTEEFPINSHFKVRDETALINMNGNNTIVFGDGTYLHDQGGMTAYAYGNGLIRLASYQYNLPCFIGGGGHSCQFYLSGPLFNSLRGTSTCEIRMMNTYFNKVTSDGPTLTVSKGFRKLLDNGVGGVTTALLNTQPYQITPEQAALNDNEYANYNYGWFDALKGGSLEPDKPRLIGSSSWSYASGWVLAQFIKGFGELSGYGLTQVEGTNIYLRGQ